MDISHINEIKLVNGVGYNLARLVTNDGIDFDGYVNLTRKITSAYLRYNREVTPVKVDGIVQQGFTNQVFDYIIRKELDIGDHLFLSKAHTLYFLGYGASLDKHIAEIERIINALCDGFITPNEAMEDLDVLVRSNLRSLKGISEAIKLASQGIGGVFR